MGRRTCIPVGQIALMDVAAARYVNQVGTEGH